MDEPPANENDPKRLTKIDLTQLEDFHFGTQWTESKETDSAQRQTRSPGAPGRFKAPDSRKDRRPSRRPPSGERDGGERPPGGAQGRGGERPSRERFQRERPAPPERPYQSPHFDVSIYPEDQGFLALIKAMRTSARTYELFEIARLILGKQERFVVVVQRRPDSEFKGESLYISVPDGLAFETEDAAIQHVFTKHLGQFFDCTEVEVDPPKGNFQFVNRCSITGELLGPPNYHRYSQILNQHHAQRLATMPFERFRDRIETVRDPELVTAWLEKMKKVVRYTWKATQEGEEAPVFDAAEEARLYLIGHARNRVIKQADGARFHGRCLDDLPQGEIRRAVEGHIERQRRFPLDTANALRGRLRREGFTIFKKGSKGVSYVCSVKRKFRLPGQTFSNTITALISFIESHPLVRIKDLPSEFLGITSVSDHPAAESTAAQIASESQAHHSPEEEQVLTRMWIDLRWLVTEGYVTEYADGTLYAGPPVAEPRRQDEHDERHERDEGDDDGPPDRGEAKAAASAEASSEAEAAKAPAAGAAGSEAASASEAQETSQQAEPDSSETGSGAPAEESAPVPQAVATEPEPEPVAEPAEAAAEAISEVEAVTAPEAEPAEGGEASADAPQEASREAESAPSESESGTPGEEPPAAPEAVADEPEPEPSAPAAGEPAGVSEEPADEPAPVTEEPMADAGGPPPAESAPEEAAASSEEVDPGRAEESDEGAEDRSAERP